MNALLAPKKETIGYGQYLIQVQCDVCESETDVTSFCIECGKNLCVNCKQVHDKLHTDHKVIPVFEARIIEHFNLKCQTHGLMFSYYCENCKINICYKCHGENHRKCNFIGINKHAEVLKSPFIKRIDKQRQHLHEIDEKSDSINNHLKNFDKLIENQIRSVEIETEKRYKDLDVEKSDLIKHLKSEQESAHKTLHEQIKSLQDLRASIDDITTSIKTQLNLVPDAGVLQLVNEGNAKLDSISIKKTFDLPNPSSFKPSTVCDQKSKQLGSLRNADNTTFIIDTRLEPLNTIADIPDTNSPTPVPNALHSTPTVSYPPLRHDIAVVRELPLCHPVFSCTSDGSTCWVVLSGLFSGEVDLHRYNQRGDQLLRVRLSHGTRHTALTTTGDLLMSGYTTVILRVNKLGEVRQFTDISALGVVSVRGLVTTRQDDVFVCVEMNDKIKDKVVTFSARGKKISELNSNLFTSTTLYGIHAVSRDTFCVQDGRWSKGGRLVLVDGGGQLVRHIDRTTTELQREITALTGDRHGHLIIATWDSEYIHVLSGEGTCKRTYHIQGSRSVRGVSVGEDDVLWFGTRTEAWTGKLITAKYLE